MADTTDASVTNSETDVDGSVRLAGGLAVEKSAAIQAKLSVLSTTDGDASGIGAALYVKGGYHVGGDTYVGGDSMIELGGKNVKVSKSVTVTDSDTAPVTVCHAPAETRQVGCAVLTTVLRVDRRCPRERVRGVQRAPQQRRRAGA